jgi:lantibiotic modifying enzyme
MEKWKKIYDKKLDSEGVLISKVIDDIENWILANYIGKKIIDFSLLNGSTGIALFFGYLSLFKRDSKRLGFAEILIDKSFNELQSSTFTYGNGLPGMLFCYQHLINEKLFEGDTDSLKFLESYDKKIAKEIVGFTRERNYDLFFGLLGIGVYFLERHRYIDKSTYLKKIASSLIGISELIDGDIAWIYYTEGKHDVISKSAICLGFVHGIPSIITFLTLIKDLLPKQFYHKFIGSAINFLVGTYKNGKGHYGFSQKIDSITLKRDFKSRLAYCYGDLGVAYSLYRVAKVIDNKQLQHFSLFVAHKMTSMEINNSGVIDSSICHGSAGNSFIFNKFFQNTNDQEFLTASQYWTKVTLNFYKQDGLTGFNFPDPLKKNKISYPNPGLLQGYSGIGLVLLSSISDVPPSWGRALLL